MIRSPLRSNVVLLAALGLLAACGGGPAPRDSASPAPGAGEMAGQDAGALPQGHPTTQARSMVRMQAQAGLQTGTVQEVLSGGGYTYARVRVGEDEMWIAGPQSPLQVGDEIAVSSAVSMGAFSSPTLERSFENLYFVGAFQSAGPPPDADRGEILEVLAGGGYTYIRARVGDADRWLAGPSTDATVGGSVLWRGGTDMGEFYSPTLDRTFDSILFVTQFWVKGP